MAFCNDCVSLPLTTTLQVYISEFIHKYRNQHLAHLRAEGCELDKEVSELDEVDPMEDVLLKKRVK